MADFTGNFISGSDYIFSSSKDFIRQMNFTSGSDYIFNSTKTFEKQFTLSSDGSAGGSAGGSALVPLYRGIFGGNYVYQKSTPPAGASDIVIVDFV